MKQRHICLDAEHWIFENDGDFWVMLDRKRIAKFDSFYDAVEYIIKLEENS